jgi:peptidoglycan/xylan/chitin deacetylase (PgdA/CDA1 family)
VKALLNLDGVVVFTYHGLKPSGRLYVAPEERKYWISRAQISEQLDLIRCNGYGVAPLTELWRRSTTPDRRKNRIAITFDDGLVSQYEIAYPLLLEAGARADFFVNTANIGRPGFLNWRQIKEMQDGGMSFHSHSHNHVYLSWLSTRDLLRQLVNSKLLLEQRLGRGAEFLSVPYGDLNGEIIEAAQRVGYRAICNSRSWPAQPGSRLVSRVVIYKHTGPDDFQRLLLGDVFCYAARAAREIFMYLPKRLLLPFRPSAPPGGNSAPWGNN